jgi:hypothetical protein
MKHSIISPKICEASLTEDSHPENFRRHLPEARGVVANLRGRETAYQRLFSEQSIADLLFPS